MTDKLPPGSLLSGTYEAGRVMGRGGWCDVHEGVHVASGMPVALKVLRSELRADRWGRATQLREAESLQAIGIDAVVASLDLVELGGFGPILVLERMRGSPFVEIVREAGRMSLAALAPYGAGLWAALAALHARGWMHGGLKLSEIFVEDRGRVRLIDLQLARRIGEPLASSAPRELTRGMFVALAPESIGHETRRDHRSDLYAAGTILYQALSSTNPFGAKNVLQIVERKTKQDPEPLSRALGGVVPPSVDAFFARVLARDPEARFQSAEEAGAAWAALEATSA